MAKILFSAISDTDPIAYNGFDGSMLHICRNYEPSIIYLYLSKDMLERHNYDDRYRKAIYKLYEAKRLTKPDIRIIERNTLSSAHLFDYFYEDFRNELLKIMAEKSADDEVIINISSGTPAMKSALQVISTFGELKAQTIQVDAPNNKEKKKQKDALEYDLEYYWALGDDNDLEKATSNRCHTSPSLNLLNFKYIEILKQQVEKCNYAAARDIINNSNVIDKDSAYSKLIEMAYLRNMLDTDKALEIYDYFRSEYEEQHKKQIDLNCFSVRNNKYREMFEYALNLNAKLVRGEYADFIRGVTPLFVDLFTEIIEANTNIVIDNCCYITPRGIKKWDKYKIDDTEVANIFTEKFGNFNYNNAISSIHLAAIAQYAIKNSEIGNLVTQLRTVEDNVRNTVAHQITSVTPQMIQEKTGYPPEKIMNLIKQAFKYTKANVGANHWNDYDRMNSLIIHELDNATK